MSVFIDTLIFEIINLDGQTLGRVQVPAEDPHAFGWGPAHRAEETWGRSQGMSLDNILDADFIAIGPVTETTGPEEIENMRSKVLALWGRASR